MNQDPSERAASGSGDQTAPSGEEQTMPAQADDARADDDTRPVHAPEPRPEAGEPGQPARIGRFVVIRRLGAGGMGVVYAAYDESLDRKVAVKLLRSDRGGSSAVSSGRARLLREAQALARLSHPNVVHVYEVGTFEDQVFVAMEFIAGETLKRWQNRPDREWREVVEVYLAAGQGLAAAHAAGIVHRDFKPDNVLVGDDKSVRVLDFGLAREAGHAGSEPERESEASRPASGSSSPRALATALTQTGAMMGTPAYMAPEQFHGRTTDARTDQFAFCVSMYEGLYGERPFSGTTMAELAHDVVTGAVRAPPSYTKVPGWLRKALLRGLAVRPDQRYTSLEELLSKLSAGLRRRSIGLASGVLAVLACGLALSVAMIERRADLPEDAAERAALASRFDRALAGLGADAERGRRPSVAEQRNRLVLAWAREHVEQDPTLGLAALANLDPQDPSWASSARMLAMAALERGVASRLRRAPAGAQVVLSPDGGRAAWVSEGRLVEHTLVAGTQRVLGQGARRQPLAFAPVGARVAGVTDDGLLAVWDGEAVLGPPCVATRLVWTASTGELCALCSGHELVRWRPGEAPRRERVEGARDLFVWPDGESLAVLLGDGTVRLRDVVGEVRHLGPADPLGSLRAAPDGDGLLALGRPARRISFATLSSELAPGFDGVRGAASALGVGTAITIEADGSVAVRNARGELERRLAHGLGKVEQVGLSSSADLAMTVDDAGGIRLWPLGAQPPTRLGGHASPVVRLAFPSASPELVAGTDNGTVRAWNVETRRSRVLGQHPSAIRHLVVSPDGSMVASASREPGARLWSLARGELLATVGSDAREGPSAIAWSPQGHRVAVGACGDDGNCSVLVHELEAATTQELGEQERAAAVLAFSDDGARLLALHPGPSPDAPWRGAVWSTADGVGRELENAGLGVPIVSTFHEASGAARIGLTGPDRSRLHVLRFGLEDGRGTTIFSRDDLLRVVADPIRPVVLLQDSDGVLTLWDLRDDDVRLVGDWSEPVESISASPAGDRLLVVAAGAPARVVELESREWRALLETPSVSVWGAQLAAALPDGTLRTWPDLPPQDPGELVVWVRGLTDASVELQDMR